MPERRSPLLTRFLSFLFLVLVASIGGYAVYMRFVAAQTEIADATTEIKMLEEKLAATEAERQNLSTILETLSNENKEFEARVNELNSTVTYLDKLSKTDRELLQKYSAVYFLSDNYTPDPLGPISDELLTETASNSYVHSKVFPFLENMMRAAHSDGAPLVVQSAYRSFGTQTGLKASYKISYGSGANRFSADQGYSEHQLGSAIDFVTPESSALTTAFRTTEQFRWLVSHAHEYGFILSYPEGNQYFQFEPWHWRFVGVDLATRLYHENKYFYDLEQREIDAYLGRIFD